MHKHSGVAIRCHKSRVQVHLVNLQLRGRIKEFLSKKSMRNDFNKFKQEIVITVIIIVLVLIKHKI